MGENFLKFNKIEINGTSIDVTKDAKATDGGGEWKPVPVFNGEAYKILYEHDISSMHGVITLNLPNNQDTQDLVDDCWDRNPNNEIIVTPTKAIGKTKIFLNGVLTKKPEWGDGNEIELVFNTDPISI